MTLLQRYVQAAIDRRLIDEWHVWDFSRTIEDRDWLRETFPVTRITPSNDIN